MNNLIKSAAVTMINALKTGNHTNMSTLIGILLDGAGNIIDMFTDGEDDGLIIVTDSLKWYKKMKDMYDNNQ